MDYYSHLPLESGFGIHFNRYSEASSSPSSTISSPSGRVCSPIFTNKSESSSSIGLQRSLSPPVRYSPHLYPPSYRTPSNSLPTGKPTTPLGYYQSNFDSNYTRSFQKPTNSFTSSNVERFRDPIGKINSFGYPPSIEEYYKNQHYNYQQSIGSYGKFNVPKNSYFNHPLGLSHRPPSIESPLSYHTSSRSDYDPIAGLHEAVRNGFKDNTTALPSTYHSIYNYPPSTLSNQFKKPNLMAPYSHGTEMYPKSYPNFPSGNLDFYRQPHPYLGSHHPYSEYSYANPQQQQHFLQYRQQQQYLANKTNIHSNQAGHLNSVGYHSPLTQNINYSAKTPELKKHEFCNQLSPENKLQTLIDEELSARLSANSEQYKNNDSNSNYNISNTKRIEDVSVEIQKSNYEKSEQRAESSISETNTLNDGNSETTVASSPLTSISSYTDSGISGCSTTIEMSDGPSSIEDKIDESNLVNGKSNNREIVENEKELENDKKPKKEIVNQAPMDSLSSEKEKENLVNSIIQKCAAEISNEGKAEKKDKHSGIQNKILFKGTANKNGRMQGNIIQKTNQDINYSQQQPLKSKIQNQRNNSSKSNTKFIKKEPVVITVCKNRVMECDFIPCKKSRNETFQCNSVQIREEIKDIKPLPAFKQAFGSTEIGRFSEFFFNHLESDNFNDYNTYDYHLSDNNNSSPCLWETGDSLEGPLYNNVYNTSPSIYSNNYNEVNNYDTIESPQDIYLGS